MSQYIFFVSFLVFFLIYGANMWRALQTAMHIIITLHHTQPGLPTVWVKTFNNAVESNILDHYITISPVLIMLNLSSKQSSTHEKITIISKVAIYMISAFK